MKNYFGLIKKLNVSRTTKIKCAIEIMLTFILRIFTLYPFLLLNYLFIGFKQMFEFLDNLFYNIVDWSKENIYISILNKKEFNQVQQQLKEIIKNKFEVK